MKTTTWESQNNDLFNIKLDHSGSVRIDFKGTETSIQISGDGEIRIGNRTVGEIYELSGDGRLKLKGNQVNIDYLEKYLSLLFESQRSGHEVHQHIEEALRCYKREVL